MAITLNGTQISVNKLNNQNVELERLNGTTVYELQNATQWVYMYHTSSDYEDYDFIISAHLSSDEMLGIYYLQNLYPASTYPKGTIAVIQDEGGSYNYFYYEAQ